MSFGPQPSSHHAAAQRRQNAERLALRPELNIGILSANNAGSAAKASRCTGRAAWSSAAAPAELSGSPVHVGARVPRPSSSPSQLPSKPKASRAVFPRPSSGRLPDLPPCATETFVWRDLERLAAAAAAAVPEGAPASLLLLPTEVLMAVLAAIHDPADLARCTATCRLLRSAAGHDQLWAAHWHRRWRLRTPLPLLSPTASSQQQQHNYAAAALCLLWERVRPTIASGGAAAGGVQGGGVQGGGRPCARAHHVAVALAGAMVVHGGWSDVSGEAEALHHGVLADTHVLRPAAAADAAARVLRGGGRDGGRGGGWEWWRPVVTGHAPRRSHHTAALTSRGDVLVAGGWDGFHRTSHVLLLHTAQWRWAALPSAGEPPPGLSAHACVPLPGAGDAFLLVGRAAGNDGTSWTDRWELRLEAEGDGGGAAADGGAPRAVAHWTRETRAGSRLEARTGHSVVLRPGRLLVLGGRRSAMVEGLKLPNGCEPPPAESAESAPLWSGLEAPLGCMRLGPAPAEPPPLCRPSLDELWRPLLRHFPCHGTDARAHATAVFYSHVPDRKAAPGESAAAASRAPRMERPPARKHHATVAVGNALVLVHGGEVYDAAPSQAVSGATYLLHASTLRWAQPPALFLSDAAPAAATAAAAAAAAASVAPAAPAAATTGAVPPHDSLASRLVAPPRRSGHTAVFIGGDGGGPDGGGHVLLYGGHGPDNRAVSDDVWLLEL